MVLVLTSGYVLIEALGFRERLGIASTRITEILKSSLDSGSISVRDTEANTDEEEETEKVEARKAAAAAEAAWLAKEIARLEERMKDKK